MHTSVSLCMCLLCARFFDQATACSRWRRHQNKFVQRWLGLSQQMGYSTDKPCTCGASIACNSLHDHHSASQLPSRSLPIPGACMAVTNPFKYSQEPLVAHDCRCHVSYPMLTNVALAAADSHARSQLFHDCLHKLHIICLPESSLCECLRHNYSEKACILMYALVIHQCNKYYTQEDVHMTCKSHYTQVANDIHGFVVKLPMQV